MSQLAPPMAAPRPMSAAPARDMPDILFVLRHYRWLLIIGTLVGTLVALSWFWVARRYYPLYTAWTQYQILPPQGINPVDNRAEQMGPDDVSSFIARQRIIVTDDGLLDDVLKSDAFQYDYRDKEKPIPSRRKSRFMLEHSEKIKDAIRDIIGIVGLPNTDLYRVTISGHDPQEIQEQVHDFSLVYENYLRAHTASEEHAKLEELRNTRKDLQNRVDIARQTADAFREAHDIPGISENYTRAGQSLATVEGLLVSAISDTNQARSSFDAVKKQIESGNFKLSPDLQGIVENDGVALGLESEKRNLEQERYVLVANHGPNYPPVKAIDIRMTYCQQKADEAREVATGADSHDDAGQCQACFGCYTGQGAGPQNAAQ